MPFDFWQPGMVQTEARLNLAAMTGAVVFLANRGTGQTIPSGGDSGSNALQWDEITTDLLGGWSASTPTRWTCPLAGWWKLEGAVAFNASAGGNTRECVWYINGGGASMGRARTFGGTMASVPVTVEARTLHRRLDVGEYVELVPAHNAGANLDTATGTYRPFLSASYGGPL
ncbi:hypothetical protein ABTX71_01555 [Streptomyces parvulus]|uniref:hypothetical protein n=1 Tax=Streptomyces parvulus TaxID=146923 RepID=UPI003322860A